MNIIAIGGGDVGVGETLPIDRELVRLAGKPNPRLLFIPTASDDSPDYTQAVATTYCALGCELDVLLLWGDDGSTEAAQRKIGQADAIYVGGGNTKKMLTRWKELGVDAMLKMHLESGGPAAGLSAGALCWFDICNSDWPQYEGIPGVNTAPLECLGLIDLSLCPHTSREGFRLAEFRAMMRDVKGPGLGLDDCCAIQIADDKYRILASSPEACAHRIEWWEGLLYESTLRPHDDFRPFTALRDLRENGTGIESTT